MANPIPTQHHIYKNFAYWIDGKLPQGREIGEYRYYVRRKPNEDPIASVDTFPLVTAANIAARVAIDLAESLFGVDQIQVLATGKAVESDAKTKKSKTR